MFFLKVVFKYERYDIYQFVFSKGTNNMRYEHIQCYAKCQPRYASTCRSHETSNSHANAKYSRNEPLKPQWVKKSTTIEEKITQLNL